MQTLSTYELVQVLGGKAAPKAHVPNVLGCSPSAPAPMTPGVQALIDATPREVRQHYADQRQMRETYGKDHPAYRMKYGDI